MIVVNDTFLFCGGSLGIINKFEVGNFKKLYVEKTKAQVNHILEFEGMIIVA